MTHGTCAYCARTKRLDSDGLIVAHYNSWTVSRTAIPSAYGRARHRVKCGGSGKRPRRVER